MDRNEAIGWLSELTKDAVKGIRTHEFEEALNMAIYDMGIIEELRHERDAALSIANELMKPSAQPEVAKDINVPINDCISRQAAIEALHTWFRDGFDEDKWWNSTHVLAALEGLPSAQPEQQWIPCSETEDLPEHEVLCCDKYGEELIGWLSCEDDQWICESDGEMMYDPIAWREKPEPWKGKEYG